MSRRQFLHAAHETASAIGQDTDSAEHVPYIVLFLQFYPEEGQWIGDCEALGVMSCGETLDEAKRSLNSLIDITLDSWEDDGERERLFRERNIRVYSGPLEQQQIEYPVLIPNHLLEMHLQPAMA